MFARLVKRNITGIQYRSVLNVSRMIPAFHLPSEVRFASSNSNDPDASKPTLDIDPFKKSERLNRPTSPHLLIYQPQLTWYLSAFHRITGAGIGGCKFLSHLLLLLPPKTIYLF